MDSLRSSNLQKLFTKVLQDKEKIRFNNAKQFLEAICLQDDPAIAIQKVCASNSGLKSLRLALATDTSISFLNGSFTSFIRYIQDPEISTIGGGSIVYQILSSIVQAEITWKAYIEAAICSKLSAEALDMLSCLLDQLLPFQSEIPEVLEVARNTSIQQQMLKHSHMEVRLRVRRIIHAIAVIEGHKPKVPNGPGGRHDNDFEDIHSINVIPSAEELASEDPYLPRLQDVEENLDEPASLAAQLDRQFRLLREDMIYDIRDELNHINKTTQSGSRKRLQVNSLILIGIVADEKRQWSLKFKCLSGLPQFTKLSQAKKKKFFRENPNYLRDDSMGCLMLNNNFLSLASIYRDIDLLEKEPAILCLKVSDSNIESVLSSMKSFCRLSFIQINTAIFSYEPILKQLKAITTLSLEQQIFLWEKDSKIEQVDYKVLAGLPKMLEEIEKNHKTNIDGYLDLQQQTVLDKSQARCFIAGVKQKLSLIQGPPGTGKSFIGSLIAKAIYKYSTEKILVVCFTHHALDQFLEDLLDLGISDRDIVRLGNTRKATARTKLLSLQEDSLKKKPTRFQYVLLQMARKVVTTKAKLLQLRFNRLQKIRFSKAEILGHLEFCSRKLPYFEAFEVPQQDGDMVQVGKKGRRVDKFYLFDQWLSGRDAGIFNETHGKKFPDIWKMEFKERQVECDQWKLDILAAVSNQVREAGEEYNKALLQIRAVYLERDLEKIRNKRIIACTTTAAAKYVKEVQSVSPGVVLVEEAGEILESHILTAIGPRTKQLILIGDHKQLRPKVNDYKLTVEKGEGYDLNKSLFERLILKGVPHEVLFQQHRMRPELSTIIKELTYPDLCDAPSTEGRPDLRGCNDNLIFIDHRVPEVETNEGMEWRDAFSPSSKKNLFECEMTLKCIRYLGQQGYRTDEIVVLTPYLGQLRLLMDHLSQSSDPVLNDLDSYDLVRAGLMPEASATHNKPKIRLSTIDNFQGDESDIVIVSLTRSNIRNDIGFLFSPERVNVMLSRARNALIIIGNSETFTKSVKGGELWNKVIEIFKTGNHIYDGLPVHCQQHPNRRLTLKVPSDFDNQCPDGGCNAPCQSKLNCGKHRCSQKCHQLSDHSKMLCHQIVEFKCDQGHSQLRKCYESKLTACQQCQKEEESRQKKLKLDLELQQKRQQADALYSASMEKINIEIQELHNEANEKQLDKERLKALQQKKKDLENLKSSMKPSVSQHQQSTNRTDKDADLPTIDSKPGHEKSPPKSSNSETGKLSKDAAESTWKYLKEVENVSNDAIDTMMSLTGLEDVKRKFLAIKAKTDVVVRQGTDMKKERLGVVMLGNPGTGKTTVARLYGKFLTSIGALRGSGFMENTGSSLTNEGVAGTKKKIEELLKSNGGVFFVDEAYQLISGNLSSGGTVLDFLLAEIENRVGQIIFVFAGYMKDMELFFQHNQGLESRLPHRMIFADYNNDELLDILAQYINSKYSGRASLEDGVKGLYSRILVNRLCENRGRTGFGNARSLQNSWAKVTERQAERLMKERRGGSQPDDFFFTKIDLIGPPPKSIIESSNAWKELQDMIGLKAVKDNVVSLINTVEKNYQREISGKIPVRVTLNKVFIGGPGTGKTSVGKLYGNILAETGLLSSSEVVIKTPSDFIGAYHGQSEENTKTILRATAGKVLIIDEAYGLFPGGSAGKGQVDPYKKAIIDTIVGEVQNSPGEDRCILLLGYEKEMKEMLDNSNDGLARRFPISEAFLFEDFNNDELLKILELKLSKQGLEATPEAKVVAIQVLSRARDRPNFGNAGEVENLISKAKMKFRSRISNTFEDNEEDVKFISEDFDPDFDRVSRSDTLCSKIFGNLVGAEKWIKKFERIQKMTVNMKARNMDPKSHIAFNWVFKGPPGTGKTTVARKVADFYYELGILSTKEYVECSASDLVAQFVGQTGPKTREVLTKALGKLLFIDEAYRLCDDTFGKEAVDELVDSVTKPQFQGKVVVILAGYSHDIDRLLNVNRGLASRFSEELLFDSMRPDACLELLEKELERIGVIITPECRTKTSSTYLELVKVLEQLSTLSSWGNGRDVITISKNLITKTFELAETSQQSLIVNGADILEELNVMLKMQKNREQHKIEVRNDLPFQMMDQPLNSTSLLHSSTLRRVDRSNKIDTEKFETETEVSDSIIKSIRDANVSEEVWIQLQADILTEMETKKSYQNTILAQEDRILELQQSSDKCDARMMELEQELNNTDEADINEMKRKREGERLEQLKFKRQKLEKEAELKRLKDEDEARKKHEAEIQKSLKMMGVCPQGFRWIKQSGGYRCAGGAHFVMDQQLK